jgi:hypothetical protein
MLRWPAGLASVGAIPKDGGRFHTYQNSRWQQPSTAFPEDDARFVGAAGFAGPYWPATGTGRPLA